MLLLGHNLDERTDFPGFICVNKRDVFKVGCRWDELRSPATEFSPALSWISAYGSVTFSGLGRDLPDAGINEAGLAIEEMSLADGAYPLMDLRPALFQMQWIQYHLATCRTVEEVIQSAARLVAEGAQVDAPGRAGSTPWRGAAQAGRLPLVRQLLEQGAKVSVRNHQGGHQDWIGGPQPAVDLGAELRQAAPDLSRSDREAMLAKTGDAIARAAAEVEGGLELDLDRGRVERETRELPEIELPPLGEIELGGAGLVTAEDSALRGGEAVDADLEFLKGTDEVQTKLELARAYVDMGDLDGARDILEEVVEEGTPEQREQASALLDRIRI